MKRSTKAALISGLVFPGLGHIYLRSFVIGLVLLCLAGGALYTVANTAIETAYEVAGEIENSGMAVDSASISRLVEQRSQQAGQSANMAEWLLMACWLVGIIDSYRIGRKQERQQEPSVTK